MTPEEWDRRAAAIRAKWKHLVENDYRDSKYWTDRGQSGSNADYACDAEIMRLGPRPGSNRPRPGAVRLTIEPDQR